MTTTATLPPWEGAFLQRLVESGVLAEDDIQTILHKARELGCSLLEVLSERGLPMESLLKVLGGVAHLPVVDLRSVSLHPEAQGRLPCGLTAPMRAVAFSLEDNKVMVAFSEPPEPDDIRTLSVFAESPIVPVLADPRVIKEVLGRASAATAPTSGSREPPVGPRTESVILEAGVDPLDEGVTLHVDDLLRYAVSVGASDLHLTANMPACIRVHGAIRPIETCPKLTHEQIREMIFGILPQAKREQFEANKELDTSHSIAGVGRFRVNVFQQRGTIAAVLRTIPHEIPPFDLLGLPRSVARFADLRRGLVLITGPTGSGKSTTLASLIDIINSSKPLHVVTIEDPIEFLHRHKRSIVNQREVGEDTHSFAEALRRVLREDPDVILVGEMRDLETISMALTAAETGHLVFGTLHTQDAPQTIDRIVDAFPTNQQEQVRAQVASSLEGVVTQQLVPRADGEGRVVAAEVMTCTSGVRNLIRQNKNHQIYSLIQTGAQYGMQTMDQSLARLVKEGRITEAMAFDRCRNEEDLRNHLRD